MAVFCFLQFPLLTSHLNLFFLRQFVIQFFSYMIFISWVLSTLFFLLFLVLKFLIQAMFLYLQNFCLRIFKSYINNNVECYVIVLFYSFRLLHGFLRDRSEAFQAKRTARAGVLSKLPSRLGPLPLRACIPSLQVPSAGRWVIGRRPCGEQGGEQGATAREEGTPGGDWQRLQWPLASPGLSLPGARMSVDWGCSHRQCWGVCPLAPATHTCPQVG